MRTQTFSRLYGIAFLVVGLVGIIPGLTPAHDHAGVMIDAESGLVLGLFPVNILHDILHIAFGFWGIAAARSYAAARGYARAVALTFGLLTLMGLFPATRTIFGLMPIYGHDVWLHALLATAATHFGFMHREAQARAAAI